MKKKRDKKAKESFRFTFPLQYDGYSYVWDSNRHMVLFFINANEIERKGIVDKINGSVTDFPKLDMIYSYGEFKSSDGRLFMIQRGWGFLTGIGGLNMDSEEAIKIQDYFANMVIEKLKNAPSPLK